MTTTIPSPRSRVYGIDFSANAANAGRHIWIASGAVESDRLRVDRCAPATEWLGVAPKRYKCLPALVEFIAGEPEAVFGLDFPFGLPRQVVPERTWDEFVLAFGERYPSVHHFAASCQARANGKELKRTTDITQKTPWSPYNLRLRSQTYHGIRDVLAPLVAANAACVLPMQQGTHSKPWVLEICPSSTLQDRRLPHQGYKKGAHAATLEQRATRGRILDGLMGSERLAPLDPSIRTRVLSDTGGDALDSIIAALATAAAVSNVDGLRPDGNDDYMVEGYVYV